MDSLSKVSNYKGSCHCKAIRFEINNVNLDESYKCNCTICLKSRGWEIRSVPSNFKITSENPQDSSSVIGGYQHGAKQMTFHFCKNCGTKTHVLGALDFFKEETNPNGLFVAVHINTLDDITQEQFSKIKVHYFDGLNDNWMTPPAYTNHL